MGLAGGYWKYDGRVRSRNECLRSESLEATEASHAAISSTLSLCVIVQQQPGALVVS